MPEDQGVNGDKWNNEASLLFEKCGWTKIADSNIDVEGADGLMHGIDAMFRYFDGFFPSKPQGVFVEAKRYRTSSFSKNKLNDWVNVIDKKIRELKSSGVFLERYAEVSQVSLRNGVLAIWFHDHENYPLFRDNFIESLLSVKIPRGQSTSNINRLFVLENDRILRLCSTIEVIERWNRDKEIPNFQHELKFVYPSSTMSGFAVQYDKCMNLEYMFSEFLFMHGKEHVGEITIDADVVFYYGNIESMSDFYRLKEALLTFDRVDSNNNLYIYHYKRSDEFRKILPDVKRLFEEDGPIKVDILPMPIYATLPDWMQL